jgi:hypothetical protein
MWDFFKLSTKRPLGQKLLALLFKYDDKEASLLCSYFENNLELKPKNNLNNSKLYEPIHNH